MERRTRGREDGFLEWKREAGDYERVLRAIAAFANAAGGEVHLGVADSGEVVGLERPDEVERRLRELVGGRLSPVPAIAVERRAVGSRPVVVVLVEPASDGPVRLETRDGRSIVCVRDGASSRPTDEVERRALERRLPVGGKPRPDEARILRALASGPLARSRVARAAGLGRRAARRALDRMERIGWTTPREDGTIRITPLGRRALEGGPPPRG